MKKIIVILMCFQSFYGHAQDWIRCVIDSSVVVKMADWYQVSEADGKLLYNAVLHDGAAAVIRMPLVEKDSALFDRTHLEAFYAKYRQQVSAGIEGKIATQEVANQDDCQLDRFTVKVFSNGSAQTIYYQTLVLPTGFYVMRFSQLDNAEEKLKADREVFFGSIQISEKFRQKFSGVERDLGYRIGYAIGENLVWVVLVLLFLFISWRSIRKSRNINV